MGLTQLREQFLDLCYQGASLHCKKGSQRAEHSRSHKISTSLDCFTRVVLDNAVGGDLPNNSKIGKLSESQLRCAIDLAIEVNQCEKDFDVLHQNSLALRADGVGYRARQSAARKRACNEASPPPPAPPGKKPKNCAGDATSFRDAFKPRPPPAVPMKSEADAAETAKVLARINADPSLSTFRKRVLSLLTQVPRGRHTTYKALADAVSRLAPGLQPDVQSVSCARAVGSAMRNNPFAPTVPCHRVLAADGKIGGFRGDWGDEGRYVQEKRKLLRDEGVRFDGKGRVVGLPFTGFM